MRLCDSCVVRHLKSGGFIKLKKIAWCYVKLQQDQLWWIDIRTNSMVSVVEAFSEVVSHEWEYYEAKKAAVSRETLRPLGSP